MVKENLAICLEKLKVSAAKAGLSPSDITLVAVTKSAALPGICEAVDLGVTDIGENKVQEALLKFEAVNAYAAKRGARLRWHMIGHLQTNKAKEAVAMFDLIHSVDSLRLALEINKQALKINKVQDVLLEVKTSLEQTKSGFSCDEVSGVVKEMISLKNISVVGLMTIAPEVSDPGQARPYFRRLRELKNDINGLRILSMGMTDDFQVAIEEGANMVRIGRGIFGERT